MIDAKLSGLDRHGEAEWSGADDEKRYIQEEPTVCATTGLVWTCTASSRVESRVMAVRILCDKNLITLEKLLTCSRQKRLVFLPGTGNNGIRVFALHAIGIVTYKLER
jgi:hypothetical protein